MQVPEAARFCPGCGEALPEFPLPPKTTLDQDRYQLLALLKTGGMGAVYKAIDHRLEKEVALKQLLPGPDIDYRKGRFLAEGNWLSRLSHPALPRVTDSFEDRGCLFLVMDLVPGLDLESLLEREGKLGPERVLTIASQLLDLLQFLHSQDPPVVYRDLKPANVILGPDGRVTLVDFGLATAPLPLTGTAIGTECYCPLEQYQGKAEPRSDLYALGATLVCLLTGEPPPPLQYPGSPAFDAVLRKAMALKPEGRFPDAAAFKAALLGRTLMGPDGKALVYIPSGVVLLGSAEDSDYSKPRQRELGGFWLDRVPVTNREFRGFVDSTGYRVQGDWARWVREAPDHPAVGVSWRDAVAYCRWAGKRLPSEDEWERAAGGPDGWKYPWGPQWEPQRCHHGASRERTMVALVGERGTVVGGSLPEGGSPEGCLDMAGNVWEWTATSEQGLRVVKGGCWANRDPRTLATSARLLFDPDSFDCRRGFRGAYDGPAPESSRTGAC